MMTTFAQYRNRRYWPGPGKGLLQCGSVFDVLGNNAAAADRQDAVRIRRSRGQDDQPTTPCSEPSERRAPDRNRIGVEELRGNGPKPLGGIAAQGPPTRNGRM